MTLSLWRHDHDDERAFRKLARQLALPIAGVLLLFIVILIWWGCWQLSEHFLA